MASQALLNITNQDFVRGESFVLDSETILQDAGRGTPLATRTVMAQRPSDEKWVPLTDVNPALTPATLVCGANGGNLAAWQAVNNGEFSIDVNGTTLDIIGINTTGIAALSDIADMINSVALGTVICVYDITGDVFSFYSPTAGVGSTITVLSAVAGGAGTDISGAGFLNGLTAVGTATQGTGGNGENIPAGIYLGDSITAAELVAGDVVDRPIVVGGIAPLNEPLLVLENSLTLADIVVEKNKTIRAVLTELGLYPEATVDGSGFEN